MSSLWLRQHLSDITSQSGEDGVLEAIFDKIGVENKWCCEFGAWDGVKFSNTNSLITSHGWSGVLIEADPERFRQLQANMESNSKVTTLHALVRDTTFEGILGETPIPRGFDLLSIDIDGEDYLVWDAMTLYRPRVVVIEVHSGFQPGVHVVPKRGNSPHGASITSMVELGHKKGYELVLHTGNAVFVLREYADLLGIDSENWTELYQGIDMGRWKDFKEEKS